MYFRCFSFECIIRSGAVGAISNSLQIFSERNKCSFESDFEKLVREIKLSSSRHNELFENINRSYLLFSDLQTDGLLLEPASKELFHSSSPKICDIAGKYEVIELFDILLSRISYHNLADGLKSIFVEPSKISDSSDWQASHHNKGCFIIKHKDVSSELYKPKFYDYKLSYSEKSNYIHEFINKIYNSFYFNTRIQYFTQLFRILIFLVFTIYDENNENNFILPLGIYLYSGLILCIFDLIFQLLNWRKTIKINILVEAIFIICLIYPKNTDIKNIISLASFYISIFRLLFILQCNLFNKYHLFQIRELFRLFLKKIFISVDTSFDSGISYSQLEGICLRFGIDYNKKLTNIIKIDDYLLNCLGRISASKNTNYLLSLNVYITSCFNSFKLLNCKLYLKPKKLAIIFKHFSEFIIKNFYSFTNSLIDDVDTRKNFAIHEIIKSRNICYKEFEKLILSLDNDGVIFMNTLEKYLVNLFDSNTYIFSRRKVFYENMYFMYSLYLCLSIFVFIVFLELFSRVFTNNFIMNKNKHQTIMVVTYSYLVVIIFCLVFHYKTDLSHYSCAFNFVNILFNRYDRIFGLIDGSYENDHEFLKMKISGLHESSYYYNGIFSEVLTNDLIQILENMVSSFSNYLPLNVTRFIVRNDGLLLPSAEYCEITILFADIVGFTSIAEKLCPFKLFELLTKYLDEIIKIIDEYNGTLLEIVGDAILVIWNSPEIENHRTAAISASLQMKKMINSNSEIFGRVNPYEIGIKCGIHTDNVLIGNIGCKKRMKYGILGDGVNLASRIESLCKRYEADIIITNNVFVNNKVKENFIICPLDVVIVQGKSKPTIIYQVLDSISNINPNLLLISKLHTIALILFLEMEFEYSIKYLDKITELHSGRKNPTSIVLYNKCKHFLKRKPEENWIRAEVLNSKDFL